MDSLKLRALIRTASGKEGGRNTETKVTARAACWATEDETVALFLYIYIFNAVIDEDENGNCMMLLWTSTT